MRLKNIGLFALKTPVLAAYSVLGAGVLLVSLPVAIPLWRWGSEAIEERKEKPDDEEDLGFVQMVEMGFIGAAMSIPVMPLLHATSLWGEAVSNLRKP